MVPHKHAQWARLRCISLVLSVGCTAGQTTPFDKLAVDDTGTASPTDADGDGVPRSEDCDDTDPAVGAPVPETCNGIDDDCDGTVDEDAEDAAVFYEDADGDGTGDAQTRACEAPADHVEVDGDCDDSNPAIGPESPELCNGIDDDCDGAVDDLDPDLADGETYWADADADGFGDAAVSEQRCEGAAGLADNAEDCDDSRDDVNPGMEEICSDGVDNDCDGTPNDCRFEGTLETADVDVQLRGRSPMADFAQSMVGGFDINGDGVGDLAVASPRFNDGDSAHVEGGALVFLGPVAPGLHDAEDLADLTLYGTTNGTDQLGLGMVPTSDLDGDGYDELLLSQTGTTSSNPGGVCVLPGPIVASPGLPPVGASGLCVDLESDENGHTPAPYGSPGDLDGDGIGDLFVGLRWEPAAVLLSMPSGPGALAELAHTTITVDRLSTTTQLGGAVAGDLDGDGLSELLLSDPDHDGAGFERGRVWVLPGDAELGTVHADDIALASFDGTVDRSHLGAVLFNALSLAGVAGIGDLDGDGLADLAIAEEQLDAFDASAPERRGAAYLFFHTPTTADTLADAELRIDGGPDDRVNRVSAGDVDGRGTPDLLVIAPYDSSRGSAQLFYGEDLALSGTLDFDDADAELGAVQSGWDADSLRMRDFAGIIGDISGDGTAELAIGDTNQGRGEAAVFFGEGL